MARHQRIQARTVALTAWGAVLASALATVGACGPADDVDPPIFPVRLLPPAPPIGFLSMIDPDFGAPDALAPWSVLEVDERGAPSRIVPAAEHPRVTVEGSALVLQPGDGVLFRTVELPADMIVSVRVRITSTAGDAEGSCPLVRGPFLDELDGDSSPRSLAQFQAAAEDDHEARRIYNRNATRILAFDGRDSGFQWGGPVADGSPRLAEARIRTREHPELRTICVRSPEIAVRVEEVAAGQAPALRRHDTAGQGPLPPSSGPRLRPRQASFSGELRPAIRIDAGTSAALEAELPPGAERLTFGVVLPGSSSAADAEPDAVRWSVELLGPIGASGEPEVADPVVLGSGTVEGGERPVRWRDVSLAWPPGHAGGPTRLVVNVTGRGGLLVAQPVVHGPAPDLSPASEGAPPVPGDRARPNLLLISIDTLRADHTGWHGYDRPTTPRLDEFAASATVFEDCASIGPYTLPSHATLLSGLFPGRHGAVSTTDRVAKATPTLATRLASRGWLTVAFTGGGFLSPDYGFTNGFDRYQSIDPIHNPESTGGLGRYSPENLDHADELDALHSLDAVGEWIESRRDAPWFAFVHTYVAHEYRPPAEDLALFDTSPGSDWGTDVQARLKPRAWLEDPPKDADVEYLVDLYDASVHFVDREIGALLDRLAEQRLLENTVVVLTSDHGEEFMEHGHLRHSQSLYEEMLHVPLVVRAPGQTEGRRVTEPVHLADVAPTVFDLLGVPQPPDTDGRSLRALVLGEVSRTTGESAGLYATVETSWSRRASLRLGAYKVIRGDISSELTYPAAAAWELYDLRNDPGEAENVFDERARVAATLRKRLEQMEAAQLQVSRPGDQAEVSQAVKDQLKALGYVDEG